MRQRRLAQYPRAAGAAQSAVNSTPEGGGEFAKAEFISAEAKKFKGPPAEGPPGNKPGYEERKAELEARL